MSDTVSKKRPFIVKSTANDYADAPLTREHTIGHAYKQARTVLAKITRHDLKRLFPCWCRRRHEAVLRLNDQAIKNKWSYLHIDPVHGGYLGGKKQTPCYICKYGIWFYCPHDGNPEGRCYAIPG
jgi:hypothetical protein